MPAFFEGLVIPFDTALLDANLRSKKQHKNATRKGDVLHSISLMGKGLFQPLRGCFCGDDGRLQIGQLGQYSQLAGIKNV